MAAAALVLATACSGLGGSDREREMNESLRAAASGRAPAYVKHDPEGPKLWKLTRAFYEEREFRPAWIERAQAGSQMEALMRALRAAEREGLDPNLYNVAMLEERHAEAARGFLTDKGFDPTEAGALDVWLTYLYLKYASDLADGLSNLVHADRSWKIAPEKFDARAHLEKALADDTIEASLAELTPRAPAYERLRTLLATYREQKAHGGWPKVRSMRLRP